MRIPCARPSCSVILFLLVCACQSAFATDTGYACIRVVRSDPGIPSVPAITLPAGCSLVSFGDYSCASEAEYCVFLQGPRGTATGVRISWTGVRMSAVVCNGSRLGLRSMPSSGDALDCDVPLQYATIREAWNTFDLSSYYNESDLAIRVEHNAQYRRAGWYADNDWVAGQAHAAVNYLFANRLVMRDWGVHHRIASAGAGRVSLLGFESWDPIHFDYPPHMHLIMYLPTVNNAGTKVPHFQMDRLGRYYANKVQVLSHPELGDQYLYAGQPMTYVDTANRVWMAATIRSDGGLDLGPTATTVAYSIVPDDAANGSVRAVRVLKNGQPWARVSCNDDTTLGILSSRIDFSDGVTASQTTTSWYDPLTGRPLTSQYPARSQPTITSADQLFAVVGSPVSYAITASPSAMSFSASGLPAGLAFNASTGAISGSPAAAGEFRASINATNASGTGTAPVTILVGRVAGNSPPTITRRANASPNPASGATVTLDVIAADDGGEPTLSYDWTASGPGTATFSRSRINAAKSTTATFAASGLYTVTATVTDAEGLVVHSSVTVEVDGAGGQTSASISFSPASAIVPPQGSQQFAATVRDQNGAALSPQPSVTWSVSGGGTISPSGLFTAGSTAGTFTVTATSGSVNGSAIVSVGDASGLTLRINFQPPTSSPVSGYLVDGGATYGARNGQTYGWNAPCEARDRNAVSDQRLDTCVLMQASSNPSARWEMAVPSGTYQIHVVCGDPSFFDGSFNLLVEGATAVTGRATSASPFRENTVTTQVTDGRLTLSNGSGSFNTKICYIEIQQMPTGNG